MEKDIGESQIKLKETEGKLESLEDDVRDGESQDLDQITKDYNLYEELEEERNTILYNKGDNRLEFLKRDYNDNTKDMSRFKTIQVICLILSLVSLGIMALVPSIRFYVLILNIVSLLGYHTCLS